MARMIFSFLMTAISFSLLVGCQSKPTTVLEETVNVFAKNGVMIDTRSAFNYASFHIEGSVNLSTHDYLVLKDPQKKTYAFDPDLNQTIERLAKRGVSPEKKIYLIGDKADSVENKKWQWLLKGLEVEDVVLVEFSDFRKDYKTGRFAAAKSERPWYLKTSEEFQKEFIVKKAKDCFVKWSDKLCK